MSNGTLQSSYTYYPWDAQITGGDTLGRLAAVQSGATLTPASLQDLAYHYDPLGNVTAVVDQLAGPQTHAFSYDALNRLVSAEASGGQDGLYSESYSYDAATGNLAGKGATSYGYQDAAHAHAVTHLDGTAAYTYDYDANGNMLQRTVGSDVYTFTYTAENKLATAALNGTPLASYVYDGDGQRVSAAVNGVVTRILDGRYEYDGALTIYYSAGGQRIAMRKAGALRYLFNDHLGSTSVTSDAAGNSVAELRYRAFGQTRFALGSTPTSLRFTGQMQDSSLGLYWYGSRLYDPYLNRWIQPDSIIPDPTNPIDFDRYAYARNNPVRYTDSSGHCIDGLSTVACLIVLGGAILKAVDYGWTAYDAYQSGRVITDPNSSRTEKMMAGLNVGLAALLEAAEPDDLLPVGLPLDDAARKAAMTGAKEAFSKGGEEAVEKYVRNGLGEYADDVLNKMGISNFATPEYLTDHFLEHGAELGYRTEREYLLGARNLTKSGEGIEKFFRKSDSATLFYNKATQEFAVLHNNGTIGTYMRAEDGWTYWLRQIEKGK